jgi:hypothetical protein
VFKLLAMLVQGSYPFFLGLAARSIGGQHLVRTDQQVTRWTLGSVLILNSLWNIGLFGLHIERLKGE